MKLKCYVHAKHNEFTKQYDFPVYCADMSKYDSFGPMVGTHEFDFEPPPYDVLVNGTVSTYRAMQKQILAEAEAKRAQLEKRINELLCLEYKP